MNPADLSIFQNVANNEDSITELLTNFLNFKSFRDSFFKQFLPEIEILDQVSSEDILTQHSIRNFRPDIVISTDKLELFFEVKVQDSPLMESQKKDYHAYLKEFKQKQTCLCFIIPMDYYDRCTLETISQQEGVKIIFWNEIIQLIVKNEIHQSSQIFNEFLKFLKYWFEPVKISFSNKQLKLMYSKEIPEVTIKLYNLIEEIKKKIIKHERLHVSKTKTSTEFGFYLDDKENNKFLFFGIWYQQWLENGYPLCYSASPKVQNNKVICNLFYKHFPENENCSLSIVSGVKEHEIDDKAVKTISDKINNYIKECLAL